MLQRLPSAAKANTPPLPQAYRPLQQIT